MIRRFLSLAAIVLALLCAACGAKDPMEPELPDVPAEEQSRLPEPVPSEQDPIGEDVSDPEDPGFDFAELSGLEFYYSSGAGAWRTVLHINADGTFHGLYTDSDMGDRDEVAYPNGTQYISRFSGRFPEPERVNDYTWRTQVVELTYEHEFGQVLEDGFRYVYTEACGIHGAENVYFYLPGAPLAELPEAYRGWVGYYDLTQTEETELPFFGLYNETAEYGFSSYSAPDPAELLQAELTTTELLAAETEKTLQTAMTQTDMNLAAEELYRIWDDMLNIAWMYLKEGLDQETMRQLTVEQLAWITEKEMAAAAAGAPYEGGTMQSMTISLEAAELTKQRVYTLAEYLK